MDWLSDLSNNFTSWFNPLTTAKMALLISFFSALIGIINIIKHYEDRSVLFIKKENDEFFLINMGLRSARNVCFRNKGSWLKTYQKISYIPPKGNVKLEGDFTYFQIIPVYTFFDKIKLFIYNQTFFNSIVLNVKVFIGSLNSIHFYLHILYLLKRRKSDRYFDYLKIKVADRHTSIYEKKKYNKNEYLVKSFNGVNDYRLIVKKLDTIFAVEKIQQTIYNSEYKWEIRIDQLNTMKVNHGLLFSSFFGRVRLPRKLPNDIRFYKEFLSKSMKSLKMNLRDLKGNEIDNFEKDEVNKTLEIFNFHDEYGDLSIPLKKVIRCVNGFVVFNDAKELKRIKYRQEIEPGKILIFSTFDGSCMLYCGNTTIESKISTTDNIDRLRDILNSTL